MVVKTGHCRPSLTKVDRWFRESDIEIQQASTICPSDNGAPLSTSGLYLSSRRQLTTAAETLPMTSGLPTSARRPGAIVYIVQSRAAH